MSMTGFGRAEAHEDDFSVCVEIRSVNHRFLDVHVRCPARYAAWEIPLRALVREALSRGKVDVGVSVRERGREGGAVRVNRELLAAFLGEVRRLRDEWGVPAEVTVRDLLGVPDLFVFAADDGDPAAARWPVAGRAAGEALGMLREARAAEGERLRAVVAEGLERLCALAAEIAALAGENKTAAAARFRERIAALAGEAGVDPARIAQEAAFLLDRLDITEECDRLGAHLAAAKELLAARGAVGKRFDFLLQEILRELNTAAAKSAHAGVSDRVVVSKTELEKIREQIQNVE